MTGDRDCSVSTYAYIDNTLEEAVGKLVAEGWRRIEIMCEGRHGEVLDWSDDRVEELKRSGERYGISWSLHAPINECNPAAISELEAALSEAVLLDALRLADILGCSYVVLHPGSLDSCDAQIDNRFAQESDDAVKRIAGFLARILDQTASSRTMIALENVPPYPGLLGVEPAFLHDIIQEVGSSRLGIVFDAGHAHMTGNGQCLLKLQQAMPRIVALHLSDNRGEADEHLGLGGGTVPLEAMIACLAASGYSGKWVLELRKAEDLEGSAARLASLRRQYPAVDPVHPAISGSGISR
ncbi:sugar phosphate isomerase/epimerase [Paenibacillus sp. HN-1]|uniref:sugar phosphate isomerase/epimerase family protein n=1 Tax=Paenibacillus TaxID=44249 RepID=UPI001CA9311E|nr:MULTISPECIES: sugar phosphate isomerase/epimerase family protein [Paenibacillus]MBY9082232.1 sugar phosphate isomerase/epimerase [Paenibacillus sp. CGMCC 1.18879]MBY9087312.1 sugar phosphate isomerase/epimerase [Paenibacillus sinensis]